MTYQTRKLTGQDAAAIERFLNPRIETSMFMLSNMQAAGLEYHGKRYQGIWLGLFDDQQRLCGVLAQFWSGMLMCQCPHEQLALLLGAMPQYSTLPILGFTGDADLGERLITQLGFTPEHFQMYSREVLYSLKLADLRLPRLLSTEGYSVHKLTAQDTFMVPWMVSYNGEALGAEDTPELRQEVTERVTADAAEGQSWVLWHHGSPVSTSKFNARLSQCVQIGGVWTPPEHRGNGYARTVVAASLLEAKASGVEQSILFTDRENPAARKAYESLGYQLVGEYGLYILRQPAPWQRLSQTA